jgi:hypothetical protein
MVKGHRGEFKLVEWPCIEFLKTLGFGVSASAATHCSYFCCGLRQSVQFQGRKGVKSIFDFWLA